jgi:hypothetical protein
MNTFGWTKVWIKISMNIMLLSNGFLMSDK